MLPDTAVVPAPTTTATTSFDPWDMPYFGGAAYFSYQATLWHREGPRRDAAVPAPTSSAATESSGGYDPWDAPYFGGPVYLSYSPALPDLPREPASAPLGAGAGVPTPLSLQPVLGGAAAENRVAETAPVTNDPARHRKRSWWARLFGRS